MSQNRAPLPAIVIYTYLTKTNSKICVNNYSWEWRAVLAHNTQMNYK